MQKTALKGGLLIDGTGREAIPDSLVLVEDKNKNREEEKYET